MFLVPAAAWHAARKLEALSAQQANSTSLIRQLQSDVEAALAQCQQLNGAATYSFTIVMPPVKPYSSRRRSKIRFAVCCCFFGRPLSPARMPSMMAMNAPSFGFAGGCVRR